MKEYLGEALAKIIGELAKTFASDIEAMKESIEENLGSHKKTLEDLKEKMTLKLGEITSLGDDGASDPTGIYDKLGETAEFAKGRVTECVETTTTGFTELFSTTMSELGEAIEDAR